MNFLSRNWGYLLGAAVVFGVAWYFSTIVSYLLIAWVLSMLGQPVKHFYMKHIRYRNKRIGAGPAAVLTILTFFLMLIGLVMLFAPTIASQARHMASVDYNAVAEKWEGPFARLDAQLHHLGVLQHGESLADRSQQALNNFFKPGVVGDILGSFLSAVGNVVAAIFSIAFILFFFLKEENLFFNMVGSLVPTKIEGKLKHALDDSSEVLGRYFTGLTLQTASFMTMITVILLIMGVKNALLIGAFGGMLNIVPYVGPILGLVFGEFITLSSHLEYELNALFPLMAKVAVAFMLTQFIDNNFTGPIIFSNSVKAHPLEIFLVTLASAKLGGVVGMVIGIPVYTVLRVMARTFLGEFKLVQRWTDHLDEKDDQTAEMVRSEQPV